MQKFYVSEEMQKKFDSQFSFPHKRTEPLQVKILDKGVILPIETNPNSEVSYFENYGGVCNSDLEFEPLSLLKNTQAPDMQVKYPAWYIGANPNLKIEDVEQSNEEVVFLGVWYHHFGHILGECISRFWYILKNDKPHYKYVIIPEKGYDTLPHEDFFRLCGISKKRLIVLKKPTQFKKVIVPEQSIRYYDYYTDEYKATIDKIKSSAPKVSLLTLRKFSKYAKLKRDIFSLLIRWIKLKLNLENPFKKIYISKRGSWPASFLGEDLIEDIFVQNGFVPIKTYNNIGPIETIQLCQLAEVLAGQSATCTHTAIFMKDGSKTIVLNRSNHIHPLQIMIDKMSNFDSTYIDAYLTTLGCDWSIGPYYLFLTDKLKEFFKDNNFKYDNEDDFYNKCDEWIEQYAKYYVEFAHNEANGVTCCYNRDLSVDDVRNIAKEKINAQRNQ